MNFLERKREDSEESKLRSLTVVKFLDNTRFDIDAEHLKAEIKIRFNALETAAVFSCDGSFTEITTGVKTTERFLIFFKGFFRQGVEGRIFLPTGIHAKDYDKYQKGRPYLLNFYYDDLQQFAPANG